MRWLFLKVAAGGSGLREVRCAAASLLAYDGLQPNALTARSIFIAVAARASFAEEFATIKATLKLKFKKFQGFVTSSI